jgi:hypothetical protein
MAEPSQAPPEEPAPIEAATGEEPVEEDEFATSDFDGSSITSTSVTSSVYNHSYENGRRVRAIAPLNRCLRGLVMLCDVAKGTTVLVSPIPSWQISDPKRRHGAEPG